MRRNTLHSHNRLVLTAVRVYMCLCRMAWWYIQRISYQVVQAFFPFSFCIQKRLHLNNSYSHARVHLVHACCEQAFWSDKNRVWFDWNAQQCSITYFGSWPFSTSWLTSSLPPFLPLLAYFEVFLNNCNRFFLFIHKITQMSKIEF